MRLLNTSTFKLESFFNQELPAYAILSHTWGDEEVTFQEVQQEDSKTLLQSLKTRTANCEHPQAVKKGYMKIMSCALQAENDGFEYIWCDTCCIDKTNSTELSEAINSMYHYYKDRLCYAYLADVPYSAKKIDLGPTAAFANSRWFTRGWTLQELIAPATVMFFDETWQLIGTRSDFAEFVSEKTGIDRDVLDGKDPNLCSIAKRMSWASKRETTREEDLAYCLMGLFQVNMPLLYGERHRAFLRLQEELMKISDDHSLFAWKMQAKEVEGSTHSGLLASSPAYFSKSRNIVPFLHHETRDDGSQDPYFMTNKGISICLTLFKARLKRGIDKYAEVLYAPLACRDAKDARGPLVIFVSWSGGNNYRRRYPHQLVPVGANILQDRSLVETRRLYFEQNKVIPRARGSQFYEFHLPGLPQQLQQSGIFLDVFPNEQVARWNPSTRVLHCSQGLVAAIHIGYKDERGKVLLIWIDQESQPRCAFDTDKEVYWVRYTTLSQMLMDHRRENLFAFGKDDIDKSGFFPYKGRTNSFERSAERWGLVERDLVRDGRRSATWTDSTFLDVKAARGIRRKSWFLQIRPKKFASKYKFEVCASIEDELVNGQGTFVVRFYRRNVDL